VLKGFFSTKDASLEAKKIAKIEVELFCYIPYFVVNKNCHSYADSKKKVNCFNSICNFFSQKNALLRNASPK